MKQISSRFSMAVHALCLIAVSPDGCTSDYIAGSVNTNPVVIRRIMGMLKQAGLVRIAPGVGGARLLKEPRDMTLLDVYRAVQAAGEHLLFRIHGEANVACPIGRNIERVLQEELTEAQQAMERRLAQTTLDRLLEQFK